MVKFEVEIPDDEWETQVKQNKLLHMELLRADVEIEALKDNTEWFNEVLGCNFIGDEQIDFREFWKVKEI
jgi:hypothetical protein